MRTIEVSEETYEKIKEQLGNEQITDVNSYEDLIGGKYFFRTVTYHSLGKVIKIVGSFLQLESASWIADSGRFSDFISNGIPSNAEVEPVGAVFVNINTVVDFYPWRHKLPTKQQ